MSNQYTIYLKLMKYIYIYSWNSNKLKDIHKLYFESNLDTCYYHIVKVVYYTPHYNTTLCEMVIAYDNYFYDPSALKPNISQLFWYPTSVHHGCHHLPPESKKENLSWFDPGPHQLLYSPWLVTWCCLCVLPCVLPFAPFSFHWFRGPSVILYSDSYSFFLLLAGFLASSSFL